MMVSSLQAGVVWAHEPHDLCCTWVHNKGRVLDVEWCGAWWVLPTPLTHSLFHCVQQHMEWMVWCVWCPLVFHYIPFVPWNDFLYALPTSHIHIQSVVKHIVEWTVCCMVVTAQSIQSHLTNSFHWKGHFWRLSGKHPPAHSFYKVKNYFEDVNVWNRSHSPQPIPLNSWYVVSGSGEH